jgi:hypothetical protein
VRYNAFHDQLILSAGSDSRVLLLSQVSAFFIFLAGNFRTIPGVLIISMFKGTVLSCGSGLIDF